MVDYDQLKKLKKISALYVEDEAEIRASLSKSLSRKLNHLHVAENGKKGLELYLKHRPPLIITDISMPVMNGLEMAELIKEQDPNAQIIITTAFNDVNYLIRAIEIGVSQYIFKPISIEKLYRAIGKSIEMLLLQDKVKRQNALIQNVLNFQSNILIVTDGYEITRFNQSFLDCCGAKSLEEFYEKHNAIGELFIKEPQFIHDSKQSNWLQFVLERPEKRNKVRMFDHKRGENRVFLLKISPLPESEHQSIVSFTDITQLESERRNLELQSITDPLTQIYNRLKFDSALDKELDRARRYNVALSLIMFDIDFFKKLNDTYGHLTGDAVLVEITELVSEKIRSLDIFARWGGEEFMVLLPETNLEGATSMADKLREIIENHLFKNAGKVTCSFGVTSYQKDESFDVLTSRVDKALYQAKDEGRNRVITL